MTSLKNINNKIYLTIHKSVQKKASYLYYYQENITLYCSPFILLKITISPN